MLTYRNSFRTLVAVGALAAACAAGSAQAAVIHFQQGVSPDAGYIADSTTVRSDRATTPQDNDPDFENIIGRVGSAFMRGLWEFDLTELETQGGFVHSVDLNMTTRDNEAGQGGTLTVNVYQYDYAFIESTATWSNPAPGDTTPGGTLGTLLTSATFNPQTQGALVTFASTPAFRTAVNDALAAPDNTLRLIAARDVETGSGNHFVRFWDEEHGTGQPDLGERPELVVTTGAAPLPTVVIIDDGSETQVDPDVTLVGTWSWRPESGTWNKPNSYDGTGSRFAAAGGPVETATYTPDIPEAGTYQVALWWPTFTTWADNTLVQVNHLGGTTEFNIDQTQNSGQWNSLGLFQFDAGTAGSVVISSEGATNTGPVADAVRFALNPVLPLVPAAAYASSTHPQNTLRPPANVINGSGMRDTDDDPMPDSHEANEWGNDINWMSNSLTVDTDPWFVIDLGEPVSFLDRMEVFNFNAESGRTDRGVGQADIYFSTQDDVGIPNPDFTDTSVWQLLAADVQFTEATGLDNYNTPDVIALGGITARWIALDIDNSLGGSFVGLSEIQIIQKVPEPSAFLLCALGMLGLGMVGRRRRPCGRP